MPVLLTSELHPPAAWTTDRHHTQRLRRHDAKPSFLGFETDLHAMKFHNKNDENMPLPSVRLGSLPVLSPALHQARDTDRNLPVLAKQQAIATGRHVSSRKHAGRQFP